MKFSGAVGDPVTQWGPLCPKLFPSERFQACVCAASAAAPATGGTQSRSSPRIHERRRLDIQSSDEDLKRLLLFPQSCDTTFTFI